MRVTLRSVNDQLGALGTTARLERFSGKTLSPAYGGRHYENGTRALSTCLG